MTEKTTAGQAATAAVAAGTAMSWRAAMADSLYGPMGFFNQASAPGGAGGHFRTSANASPLFATAIMRLINAADDALGRPATLDVVDIGAGGGHLLRRLLDLAPAHIARRLRLAAVEVAPRPADLPAEIDWFTTPPPQGAVTGVVLATEWLDNVPIDIAQVDADGVLRYVYVDPTTGVELLGGELTEADHLWTARWWSWGFRQPGARIELGGPRDQAWASAVAALAAGLALTVDYGHLWQTRPFAGTLSAFYAGRYTEPIPDGTRDITMHVAIDAVCAAGEAIAGAPARLLTQAEVLRALGLSGARPPLALASTDPSGYVRALSLASEASELMEPSGLGGHYWVIQPVGLSPASLPTELWA